MSEFSRNDHAHMTRALELARRGCYGAHPNPMVGCVLVQQDKVVGEGWHARVGEAHAERMALQEAGDRARGGTAYVTLEPCAFQGRTPPCCEALIDAGIAVVFVAMEDPHPKVSGRGLQRLRDAGIEVRVGLLGAAAEALNPGFLSVQRRGRPYVRLKIAASLDGNVAMANGQSQWITGPQARRDVQQFRARSGAVLTGIGTVLADDPSLTVREPALLEYQRQPLRAIVDSTLRMPLSAGMLDLPGDTVLFCHDERRRAALEQAGCAVIRAAADNGRVDLAAVLSELARRDVIDVLVEAGPGLAGSFVDQGLADELLLYQAPHIMGSETTTMLATPRWTELSDRRELQIVERCMIGDDQRITARFRN